MPDPVLISRDARGIVTATLNRPELGNAYNAALLEALIAGLESLARDATIRALVVRGAGRHFAAGADINWLAEVAAYPPEQAFEASLATTRAMQLLNEFPRPTLAVIQGACFGGGAGIACCVDVALATPAAEFGITVGGKSEMKVSGSGTSWVSMADGSQLDSKLTLNVELAAGQAGGGGSKPMKIGNSVNITRIK